MRFLLGIVSFLIVVSLAACSTGAQPSQDDGQIRVLVTTGHLADAVAAVGGEAIELTPLLGPGIDPHTYVATEGDILTLQNAQVIFYNGLRLEAQMDRVLEQIATSGQVRVVGVGDTLETSQLLNWEPEAGLPFDPHIWNDVQLWQQAVSVIAETLSEVDPENAELFQANATTYQAELTGLDTYLREQAAQIPAERRVLVTAHDAFGYFGRAYGFEVEAVQGISTEAEASTADIRALSDLVISREIPAIFVESTISPRTIEAVIASVQSSGRELNLGGELYSDALGGPGSGAETYIEMMRHNIDTIVSALQ